MYGLILLSFGDVSVGEVSFGLSPNFGSWKAGGGGAPTSDAGRGFFFFFFFDIVVASFGESFGGEAEAGFSRRVVVFIVIVIVAISSAGCAARGGGAGARREGTDGVGNGCGARATGPAAPALCRSFTRATAICAAEYDFEWLARVRRSRNDSAVRSLAGSSTLALSRSFTRASAICAAENDFEWLVAKRRFLLASPSASSSSAIAMTSAAASLTFAPSRDAFRELEREPCLLKLFVSFWSERAVPSSAVNTPPPSLFRFIPLVTCQSMALLQNVFDFFCSK